MKAFLQLVAMSVLGFGICWAQMERTFERTINLNGPVTLDLLTDSGGITVTPGSPGSIRIRGFLRGQHGFFSFGNVEDRIRRLEANPPIQQNGNTVRAGYVSDRSLLNGISLRWEIAAPSESQVRARADSGGIRVEGIKGPVDCKTDSGGIEASHIGSEVHAVADSGGIHIHEVHGAVYARADSGGIDALDIAGNIDVQTDSGGIRLSQTIAAPVRARADSGGASLRLASSGGYDIRVKTESGRVTLPEMAVHGNLSRREAEGRVRGGGPLVDIQVGSGNIDVR